jgi:hypothetical protein
MAHDRMQQRQRARRTPILILCEGSKTEPNYLGALVRDLGLTAVSVPRNHNTDPVGLVRSALVAAKRDRDLRAFVLFDRDDHASYFEAVGLAEQHPLFGKRLYLARSVPSFELWLFYHFEFCRAPLTRQQALARLQAVYPPYEKGNVACMDEFISRLPTALSNSARAMDDAVVTSEPNCSTEMHCLVHYLQEKSAEQH